MRSIIFFTTIVLLIGATACQTEQTKKQYFEESPEIEIAKKAIKAFTNGDLEVYRSCYADTAIFWHNVYFTKDPGITIDEQLNFLSSILDFQEYYYYEDEIWEMIIQNDGENWVHFWGNFITKYSGDSIEISVPIHFAFSIVENKIVYEAGFWDNLPFYLAEQRLAAMNEE